MKYKNNSLWNDLIGKWLHFQSRPFTSRYPIKANNIIFKKKIKKVNILNC